MATSTETKIALLGKSIDDNQKTTTESLARLERKVDDNQAEIISRMDKFAFEAIKDHDRDVNDLKTGNTTMRQELQVQIDALKKQSDADHELINKGGVKIANALNSGVTKAIVGILVVGVIIAIIVVGSRLYPAVGGH